jgi:hypothetical protein
VCFFFVLFFFLVEWSACQVNELVRSFEQHDPATLAEALNPDGVWLAMLASSKPCALAVVEDCLRRFNLRDLLDAKDELGRSALDVATPDCKVLLQNWYQSSLSTWFFCLHVSYFFSVGCFSVVVTRSKVLLWCTRARPARFASSQTTILAKRSQ